MRMNQLVSTSRNFLAVVPDQPTIAKLSELIEQLQARLINAKVRWVVSENLHLTLRFIGGLAQEKIPILKQALASVLKDFKAFRLILSHLHLFPSQAKPRIIALQAQPLAKLSQVALAMETAVQSISTPKLSRPFRSHLTLARIKGGDKIFPESLAVPNQLNFQFDEVFLLTSIPTADGVNYHKLAGFKLKT